MSDARARSLARVEADLAAVPESLDAALAVPLPTMLQPPARVVTTGIGGSEGPARLLARRLAARGGAASFRPLSAFAAGDMGSPEGDLLVVFSQGLSPNALLALDASTPFATRWLVTSVGHGPTREDRRRLLDELVGAGVVPIVVPPGEERGMLVRWVGPTVAALTALRLAGSLGDEGCAQARLADAPSRYRAAAGDLPPLPERPALVVAGVDVDEVVGIRWKILEALLEGDPPVWDVLQTAHGALQALHVAPRGVVTLERPRAADLVERFTAALPAAAPLTRLLASRDDALAVIELTAMTDAALVAALRARPRDLFDWSGRGREEALYGLGRR